MTDLDKKKIELQKRCAQAKFFLINNLVDSIDRSNGVKSQSFDQVQYINELAQHFITKKSHWYNYTYLFDLVITGARFFKNETS